MADRIQHRRDTAARWAEVNPVLLEGEIGYVLDNPNQHKIGDGEHAWNDLPLRGFTGNIAQSLGNDENAVVSQKVVTEEINNIKEAISNSGGEGSKEVTRAEFELVKVQSEDTFNDFSELGMTEKADIDGYEIALTKKTNTAEKTKVKIPVYDTQNPAAHPVGLVDEIFVEDMEVMMDGKIETALEGFSPEGGGGSVQVVQTTGDSTSAVMSQKAVTEELEYITNLAETSYSNVGTDSFPKFSTAKNYKKGDVVQSGGKLYQFTVDYVSGESYFDEVVKRYLIAPVTKDLENRTTILEENFSTVSGSIFESLGDHNDRIEQNVERLTVVEANSGVNEYSLFDTAFSYDKGDILRMEDGSLIRLTADYVAGSGEPQYEPWNLVLDTERSKTPDNMGYVILRKGLSFAEQVTKENTIYEIRYDFDLGGETVTIPSGCVLNFTGGSVSNGILSLNNTSVKSEAVCLKNVVLTKDSTNGFLSEVMSSWFVEMQNAVDSASSLGVALCIDSDTTISDSIKIKKNFTTIHGLSSRIHIRCTKDCPIFELEKEGTLNYIKIYNLHLSGGSYGIYRDYADGDSFGNYDKGGSLQVADFYNIFFEEQSKSGICIKGYGFGCINVHHNHFLTSDSCKSEESAINIEVFWANRNHINDCRFNGYFTGAIKVKCNQFIQNEIDNLWCEYIYMQLANSYAVHIEGANVFDFVIRASYFERLIKYGDASNGEIPIYIYANGGLARNISIKELGVSSNVVSSTWIKLKGTIVGLLVSENGSYIGETVYIDSSAAQVYSAVLLSNAITFNIISPDNFRYVDVFSGIQNNAGKILENASKIAKLEGEKDDAIYRLPTGNTQEWVVDIPAKNGSYLFNVIINPASTAKIYIGTFIVQKAKDVCEISLLKETNSSAGYDYEITSVNVAVRDEVISVLATFKNTWTGSGNAVLEYKISNLLYSEL